MRRAFMIAAALALCFAALSGCGTSPVQPEATEPVESVAYDPWEECGHEVKPIISAELVSQEKPLVFFELMEQPKMEGIKVRLTYKDGSSEVVDAYDLEMCSWSTDPSFDAGVHHLKGMCVNTWPIWPLERPALKPGKHQIAMFCVDGKYWWNTDESNSPRFDSLNPEDVGVAYCMVEVYAQTGDEYIAEHNVPFALVTESDASDVPMLREENSYSPNYGIVKLLAKESGTYAIVINDGSLGYENYDGAVIIDSEKLASDNYSMSNPRYYAKLNANEPIFLRVGFHFGDAPVHVSPMKRVLDEEVSWEE